MGQSTEELSTQIAGTRESLAADVDALQDRVSPRAVAHRQKEAAKSRLSSVRDRVMGSAASAKDSAAGTGSGAVSGVQDAAGSAASTAQEKFEGAPIAAGLVAFGAGMVLAGLFPATDVEAKAAQRAVDTATADGGLVDQAKAAGQDVGQQVQQTATEAAQQVKDTATDAAGTVRDQGQSAADSVRSDVQGG